MQKKYLIFLLIFGLLIGATCISANDTVDDNTLVEDTTDNSETPGNIVDGADDTSEDTTNNNDANDDVINFNVSANNDNVNTFDNDKTTLNTTSDFIKILDLARALYPELNYSINTYQLAYPYFTDEDMEILAEELSDVDSDAFADVISALLNHDIDSANTALGKVSTDDFQLFFEIFEDLLNYEDNTQDTYYYPYKQATKTSSYQKNIPSTQTTNNQITGNGNGQTNGHNPIIYKNTNQIKSNDKTIYGPDYAKLYAILMGIFERYENGEIDYDEVCRLLEQNGFSTEELVLNEDGSLTYFDIIVKAPKSSNTDDSTDIPDDSQDDVNPAPEDNSEKDNDNTDSTTTNNEDTSNTVEDNTEKVDSTTNEDKTA
jgi:hypothetical protein